MGEGVGIGPVGSVDTDAQETSSTRALPTIALVVHLHRNARMLLILLEALLALAVLILIVWWTMFSGRPKGELPEDEQDENTR